MARARNIKPGFFKNEDLAECTPWARLCFAGLWVLADREGRLEDRPKRIKGELFAFDSIEVEPLLAELVRGRFIERYKAQDGRGLIQVMQFLKHQNPHHREPESDLPPPQSPGLCTDASAPKPEALPPSQPPEAQGKPKAGPGLDPPTGDMARGSSRAESGIDESGTLNPVTGEKTARKRAAVEHVPLDAMVAAGIEPECAVDFIAHKQRLKAPLTPRAWADHLREAQKAGMTPQAAAEKVMAKGWKGFDASYVAGRQAQPQRQNGHEAEPEWRREQRERNEAALGPYAAKRRTTTVDMEAPDGPAFLVG